MKYLDILRNQIKDIKELSITEAQSLYKEIQSIDNEEKKKLYKDKLILGTLPVIYNYIDNNKMDMFTNSIYSIEDIVSAFTEVWINIINNGSLLNVTEYSSLLNKSFFNDVYNKLGNKQIGVKNIFGLSKQEFISLFMKYISLKEQGIKFNQYKEGITRSNYFYYYEYMNLTLTFDAIYNKLELYKIEDKNKLITIIDNYFDLILSTGLEDSLSTALNIPDNKNLESDTIEQEFTREAFNAVDKTLKPDIVKDMIYKRYGVGIDEPESYEEIGNDYNLFFQTVKLKVERRLNRIRNYQKVKAYREDMNDDVFPRNCR